jgi:hypothetical protein
MRTKNINLKEEEARTEHFLEKVRLHFFYNPQLNKFKTTSKNIKEKSKYSMHKLIWNKEY